MDRKAEVSYDLQRYMVFNKFLSSQLTQVENTFEGMPETWIYKSITCAPEYDQNTKLENIVMQKKQNCLRNVYEVFLPIVNELLLNGTANNACLLVDPEGFVVYYYQGSGLGLGMKCNATTGLNHFVMEELRSGKIVEAELHAAGSNDFLYSILSPIIDLNNGLTAILIYASDQNISQELRIKYYMGIQLCNAHYQYQQYLPHYANSILNGISDCALLLDEHDTIIQANRECIDFFSISEFELFGHPLKGILHQDSQNWNITSSNKSIVFTRNSREMPCNVVNKYSFTTLFNRTQHMLIFKPDDSQQYKEFSLIDNRSGSPFERLVGETPPIKKIKLLGERIADKPTNVLIEGESGTGKELLAEAIHLQSGRKGPFVPINCGAIPKELLLSELFGYEGGTFTGARRDGKAGKFEIADQGTIYLDEIGEMPLDMQVSLLRFLQDKRINRIGSNRVKQVDVRVIAATNRTLSEEIFKGTFREDLYYRLSVISITMPPLRERQHDIPVIVQYILQNLCKEYNMNQPIIESEVMELLSNQYWKGNVRELRNVIEYALLTCLGNVINKEALPSNLLTRKADIPKGNGKIKEYNKVAIIEALDNCNGNISLAAKTLGIARNTLYKRMNEFNIAQPTD